MNKNVWCVATSKGESEKPIVRVFPIRLGYDNLAGKYSDYEFVVPCVTKKQAYSTAAIWEQNFRQNEQEEQER